eukprot:12061762-Prorocentrum_lima.AAC.1
MTSSLVGSEMCIRDRIREIPREKRFAYVPMHAVESGAPSFFEDMQMTQAVSYTHLTLPTICSV